LTLQKLIIKGLLSLAYLGFGDDAIALINYIQISYWLAIGTAVAALFYLRKKMPDAPRPIKVSECTISFFSFHFYVFRST
jgi:hypothetical protein